MASCSYNWTGEWYGPGTAAFVLRDLAKLHHRKYRGPIEVFVCQGDVLFISEVEKYATSAGETHSFVREWGRDRSDSLTPLSAASLSPNSVNGPSQDASVADGTPEADVDASQGSSYLEVSLLSSSIDLGDSDTPPPPQPPESIPNKDIIDAQSILEKIDKQLSKAESTGAVAETESKPCSQADDLDDQSCNTPPSLEDSPSGIQILSPKVYAVSDVGSERVHNPFYDPLLNPPPRTQEERPWVCGLMLLIPLRLGINHVNPEYFEELKEVLESRYSLGILGGRPKHAIYFVGHRGDLLLGLDPHTIHTNPSLGEPFPSNEYMSQVHVTEFQCLDLTMLDPSVALAYYFRNRAEFEAFCESTRVSVESKKQAGRRSLFSLQQARPSYEHNGEGEWGHSDGEVSGDDEEYVFI